MPWVQMVRARTTVEAGARLTRFELGMPLALRRAGSGLYYMAKNAIVLNDRAELLLKEKLTSPKGLIREFSIWKLKGSVRYPDRLKYRLAFVDPMRGIVHLLFDNHWPKGHHVHFGDEEQPYEFVSVEELLLEFLTRSDSIERGLP